MANRQFSTMDQVRHDIDSGRTGDKIPAWDSAAAPLGTDEEAAGTPTPAVSRPARESTENSQLQRQRQRAAAIIGTLAAVGFVAAWLARDWAL